MRSNSNYPIADPSTWRLDEIAESDSNRANELEGAGPSDALVESLKNAFDDALDRKDGARFGREHLDEKWEHVRAVVQFPVGAKLFDWFFNARTGYRAHFRAHYKLGLRFNNRIVKALLPVLDARLPDTVLGREIGREFKDCGEATIPKKLLMCSLHPYVVKIWLCTKRIGLNGGIEVLPTGVVGEPRVLLEDETSWITYYRNDENAWLDIKGGFMGACPYQPKGPFKRAKKLSDSGKA